MSYLLNNQQRLNDLVFNGRNKNYGAYAIRSTYGATLFKSLSVVVFGFSAFMSLAFYFSQHTGNSEKQNILPLEQDSTLNIIYHLKKEEAAAAAASEKKAAPAEKQPSAENTVVTVVDSTATESNTTLPQDPIAAETPSVGSLLAMHSGSASGSAGGSGNKASGTSTNEAVETYAVDTEPRFKGGLKALMRYISTNLRYPEAAVEQGKTGTVFVKFVVDEQGKVSQVKLLNNLGYGMDEEARRVVSSIPDFESPGKMGDQPVKVYYQLPIRFVLH